MLSRADNEELVVEGLLSAIEEGVGCDSAALLLADGPSWVLEGTIGLVDPDRANVPAEAAVALLGEDTFCHLARWPIDEEPPALVRFGIEAVFALRIGSQILGVLMLGGKGRAPYADPQLEFVSMVCDRAAIALRTARLTEDHIERERQAATGRMAVILAHDLGKELNWLGRIARRLPDRIGDQRRLLRDVDLIREFSESLVPALRGFVREARDRIQSIDGPAPLDDVIDSSVRRMNRIHGCERVSESVDPSVRSVLVDRSLRRVLAIVLDNALLSSDAGEPVELYATCDEGHVRIQVEDRGPGIAPDMRERVFEAGFTTRESSGGLGVGLTVCRDLVNGLEGSLAIEGRTGGGARVIVRIPGDLASGLKLAVGG